jgi:exosome complex component CSL4
MDAFALKETIDSNESPTMGDSSIPLSEERITDDTASNTVDNTASNGASNGSGKFVLPGDFVGTTEEFRAGAQTYEKTGGVYAAIAGTAKVDGDVVIGQIVGLRDSLAMVTIAGAKGVVDREIPNVGSAVVHVSNVKRGYVKDIAHEFGIFDILKARVVDLKNMRLDTSEPDLGVMKALCSKCPECGRIETRKLATGYGTGII